MTRVRLTRRYFLVAAVAAVTVSPARADRWEWRGAALGAEARIVLTGPRDRAKAALAAAVDEIRRLEAMFSLHLPGSCLSRLNAAGTLAHPPRELRRLLSEAEAWRRRTEGAFDARVQPLWAHRASGGTGPGPVQTVRHARVQIAPAGVRLSAGTALTLNGIAQGTVADRVAGLLAHHGFRPPVIDAGEMRLGAGQTVAIPHAGVTLAPGPAAVATSAPGALRFADGGHHLLSARTGHSPNHWRAVTVVAPDAETADALSTAFAVSARARIGDLVPRDVSVIATEPSGRVHRFGRRLEEI